MSFAIRPHEIILCRTMGAKFFENGDRSFDPNLSC